MPKTETSSEANLKNYAKPSEKILKRLEKEIENLPESDKNKLIYKLLTEHYSHSLKGILQIMTQKDDYKVIDQDLPIKRMDK